MTGVPPRFRRLGTAGFQQADYPTAWWQKGIAFVNSIEELQTKALGKILTGDPKYDQPVGDFYRQQGFHDLLQDAGVDPKLAIGLGITAAIVNPLDFFNLFAIGKLSKIGQVRKLTATAKALEGGLETVKIGGKSISQFSKAGLTKGLVDLKKAVEAAKVRKVSGAQAAMRNKEVRQLNRSIKQFERQIPEIDAQNKILRKLQADGLSLDEIADIPGVVEQIRSGDRSLFGFTSPFSTAHIPFKSTAPLKDATLFAVPGIGKGRLAAAIAGAGAAVGSRAGSAAKNILNATVRTFQTSDGGARLRPAVLERGMKDTLEELKLVMGDVGGEVDQFMAAAENILVRNAGLPKAQRLKVADALEDRFPLHLGKLRALRQAIEDAPADKIQERIAQNVRDIATENNLGPLTKEQQLDINPSRLGQLDTSRALEAWDNSAVEAVKIRGGHQYILTEDFVVTKLGGRFARTSETELKQIFENTQTARIPALTTPKVVVRGNERFLVARKIAAGQPVTPETLRASHLENLGRGAAQLAPRKAAIGELSEAEVLISPFGGVQILQPDAFLKNTLGSNKESRNLSEAVIRDLGDRNTVNPDLLNLGMLATTGAARSVKSRNFSYINSLIDADLGIQKGGVGHIDVKFLMDAENMGAVRQLLRGELPDDLEGFLNANNIQERLSELQEARKIGERPSMRPISYMIGTNGKIFIVDGTDRLAAAAIDGLSAVPVFKRPFLGEILEDTGAFYSSYGLRGADVLAASRTEPATARFLSEAAGDPLRAAKVQGVLDDSYRLLSGSGRAQRILKGPLIRGPAQNRRASEVIERLGNFATNQPGKNPRVVGLQQHSFARTLTAAYGDREVAALRIADIAVQAKATDEITVAQDFQRRLIEDLQSRGSKRETFPIDLDNPGLQSAKETEIAELQEAASEFLDGLAKDRIFTANSLNVERAAIASEALGGTVIGQVAEGLLAVNVNKTLAETTDTFKQFVSRTTDPSNVHHLDQAVVIGSDGPRNLQFGDLVGRNHPRINRAIPLPLRFAITPQMKVELANKKIYHISPDEKLGLLTDDALGVMKSEHGAVWFKTRSGDMFIRPGDATPHPDVSIDSVTQMLVDTFQEASAAIKLQEFGFLMRDKLVVSNPLGGMMQVLDPANVKVMESRLRETAQQFIDMGLNPGVRMDVVSQFDPSVWRQIYNAQRRFPTVGHVAEKEFKLKVPEGMAGRAVDIDLNAPFVAVKINRLDMSEPAREITKWLETQTDEAIRREVKAGLPIGFFADYFPRFMPQGTRDALNSAWEAVIGKTPRLKRTLLASPRLIKRRFTDLGTQEINAIFKGADIDMSDIIASAASKEQAALLTKMSEAIDGTFDFFHADPIISTVIRQIESFKVKAERAVLDSIQVGEKSGLLFKGTPKALARVGVRNKRLAKLEGDRFALQDTITQTEAEIKELATAGEAAREPVTKLTDDLEKAVKKEQTVAEEINSLTRESFNDHLIAKEVSDNPRKVWIPGTAARKLLDNGAISEANMLSHPTGDLVQVEFTDSIKAINGVETDVLLMTPELEEVMTRLFDLKKNRAGEFGNLLKVYDTMLGLWKQWTLFPIPAFHVRNMFSDLFLMTLGRGVSVRALTTSWEHMSLLRRFKQGRVGYQEAFDLMETNRLASATGDSRSMAELWNAFIGQGGSHGQFVWNEFNRSARFTGPVNELARIASKHNVDGASSLIDDSLAGRLSNIPPVGAGRRLQGSRESWLRFSVFLNEWQNTGDFTAAGQKMKTLLYDYSNLTSFERNFVRRIIPFYAWSRFNIPRMMTTLATEPVFHARVQQALNNVVMDATDGVPLDEGALPEFLARTGLVWGRNKDGTYKVKSLEGLLPVYDLVPLVYSAPSRFLLQNVSPLLKLPFEQLLNRSFFTGRDLEEIPGEPARSATLARLGATRRASLAGPLSLINVVWNEKNITDLFRFGKQLSQVVDFTTNSSNFRGETDVDAASAFVELTIGRSYDIDPQTTAYYTTRKDEAYHNTLMSLGRRAQRQNNMPAYHVFSRRLMQLRLTRPPR